MTTPRRSALIEFDSPAETTVADAPPVPEFGDADSAFSASAKATRMAARKPNPLLRFFGAIFGFFISFMISVALWDFVTSMLARNIWLGRLAFVLLACLAAVVVLLILKEILAMRRLAKIETLQRIFQSAQTSLNLTESQKASKAFRAHYAKRPEMARGLEKIEKAEAEALEAEALLSSAEYALAPLDQEAETQIKAAARQVAGVTALVPLAFADVLFVLTANMRMVRNIAEIYGGRTSTLGSWRLLKSVAGHLVATGAVAIGDDLIDGMLGGSVLSKISRRFGEGAINGTLTARVGIAALEVCRPVPFHVTKRPSLRAIAGAALGDMFSKGAKSDV